MGGVDLLDNNVSNYRINMRGKKWYMPLILWMLDVTMTNAWTLSRAYGKGLDSLAFRRDVVLALLKNYGTPRIAPGPSGQASAVSRVPLPLRQDHKNHLIITNQTRRRCAVCKNKTVKACKKCNVALHDKCFEKFHM